MSQHSEIIQTIINVCEGRGHYEVHFPDGSTKKMSWMDLHVDLKFDDPKLHEQVKFHWVNEGEEAHGTSHLSSH